MNVDQGVVLAALVALVAGLLSGRASAGSLFGGVALFFIAMGYVAVDAALAQLVNPGWGRCSTGRRASNAHWARCSEAPIAGHC